MNCQYCNKHYVYNTGYIECDGYSEHGFCSYNCKEQYFKTIINPNIEELIKSFSIKQYDLLYSVLNECETFQYDILETMESWRNNVNE